MRDSNLPWSTPNYSMTARSMTLCSTNPMLERARTTLYMLASNPLGQMMVVMMSSGMLRASSRASPSTSSEKANHQGLKLRCLYAPELNKTGPKSTNT